jgi:hypothetical protein
VTRILGIGCGFLLFGGLCIVGLAIPWMNTQMSDATEAAEGFLDDVHDDAWGNALARMSADYQSTHSAAQLQTSVEGISELANHSASMLTSIETHDDGHVTVEGSLFGEDGEAPVAFELTEVGDYWYVDLVAVAGRPLP